MSKNAPKIDLVKKLAARLVKAAPAKLPEPADPLARMIRAFLEYDSDLPRAEAAEKKILSSMVDYNELRVTPAIELAALLGVRYPFAEARAAALHRTLQSVFDREHHMHLSRLADMKKQEIRGYLQSLHGITPYVEAVVALESFGIAAAPVDVKLLLWFRSKEAVGEETDVKALQVLLERHVKAAQMLAFHAGARHELESFTPRVWPAPVKHVEPQAPRPAAPPAEPPRAPAAKAIQNGKAEVKKPAPREPRRTERARPARSAARK